jgi:hypothetical protein
MTYIAMVADQHIGILWRPLLIKSISLPRFGAFLSSGMLLRLALFVYTSVKFEKEQKVSTVKYLIGYIRNSTPRYCDILTQLLAEED